MTECSNGWGVVKSLAIRIPRTGPTLSHRFFSAESKNEGVRLNNRHLLVIATRMAWEKTH